MAVGGRWPVHGVEQVKLLEYAVGPQVKIVANKVFYRLLGNMTGAKGGDRNGCRLGHANGIAQLHLARSEEHTSELQSRGHLVCRLLLEKKKYMRYTTLHTL